MRDEELDALRRRAFAIAYRMLGTVSEAEDVVQETLLRLHRVTGAGEAIQSPEAFVATVATRQAIDHLRSARVRREEYVGDWLPEPLVEAAEGDPAQRAEMVDSLSMAFLVLLERLSPEQRAALLLRDVFDYGYDEIATILDKTPENVRQLAARARRHVRDQRPRFAVSGEQRERLAASFFAALQHGDLPALEATLAADVVLRGDGGGKVPALARSIGGPQRVARTLLAWVRAGRAFGGSLEPATVNGGPGVVIRDAAGRLISVWGLEVDDRGVRGLAAIVNPDKLRHVEPVGSIADAFAAAKRAGDR